MDSRELLQAVYDWFHADRRRWTTGAYSRRDDGEPCTSGDEIASACLLGQLFRYNCGRVHWDSAGHIAARDTVAAQTIAFLYEFAAWKYSYTPRVDNLVRINDVGGYRAVLKLLAAAIAYLDDPEST